MLSYGVAFSTSSAPDRELMAQIVDVHHPNVRATLIEEAISRFYFVRSLDGMRKPPSTSELIDWIGAKLREVLKKTN